MDNIDPLTGLPLTGAELNVPAAAGQPAESNVASLKDVLGGALKKDFPSDEAALKAVVDTFSFVGKKQEAQAPQSSNDAPSRAELQALQQQVAAAEFYASHPEFTGYRDLISSMGSNPEQVVTNQVFLKAFNALKAQNENQTTPLNSSPRIGIPNDNSDYQRDLEQARATGNWTLFMQKHKGLESPQ